MNKPTWADRIGWCSDAGLSMRDIAEQIGLGYRTLEDLAGGRTAETTLSQAKIGRLRFLTDRFRPAAEPAYSLNDAFVPDLLLLASRQSKPERCAMARNLESALRERISRLSQLEVANRTGIEKTAIHRLVVGERGIYLDEVHDVLHALGMAAIECDGDLVSLPKAEYDALRTLAKRGLE